MATRVKNFEDSGELDDGTMYNRMLTIRETTETQGSCTITREVIEDRVEIGGEFCVVYVVLVDGENVEVNVEDHVSVSNRSGFQRKWEEINRMWANILDDLVLGVSVDHRGEDIRTRMGTLYNDAMMITFLLKILLMTMVLGMIFYLMTLSLK